MHKSITAFVAFLTLLAPRADAQTPAPSTTKLASLAPVSEAQARELAEQVRQEFMHAWNAYKTHAWGHDDLRPLSKSFRDWHEKPLLMTPVDALSTMLLMGFDDEAKRTRDYIAANLSFDHDISVKNFEITIRILGGLLSAYQLSKDERLLALAEDLGNRLLPAFNSPTGRRTTRNGVA